MDNGELRSNCKLTPHLLNLSGQEKMKVRYAVVLFSTTTAALWRKVYLNRPKEAEFILLINDWFDLFNSRTVKEAKKTKVPFGLNLAQQLDLLDRTESAILELRVGDAKYLYPFQRGFLISISSMRGLFQELSGSHLRISYILTHRVNQDLAENAFSVIRKIGAGHVKPSAVDAKRRLKLLCLTWGANTFKTSSVEAEDNEPCLSARMIHSLTTVQSNDADNSSPRIILPRWRLTSRT